MLFINRWARPLRQPARTGASQARKSRRLAISRLEHLEDRKVMTIAFTGNVLADFPVAGGPGVKYLTGGQAQKPLIPGDLADLISVTGFDLTGVALSYDSVTDQLAIGILQPDNGKTGQRVIAGDADNNLNSGTVAPAVSAISPGFADVPDMGGTEEMGVYLDLNNDGSPDIIAGIAGQPSPKKNYQVALAVPNPNNPKSPPQFGQNLTGFAGNIYLVNDPDHPAMEFTINRFSQLFQQVIGSPLTQTQAMTAGAVGRAASDSGISEGVYFAQPFNWQEVSPATDLSIQKYDEPDPVQAGDSLVYTIYVRNNGPYADPAVKVNDAVPAGVQVLYVLTSQGTVATSATGFSANLGTIAAGGSAAITLVVQPVAGTAGTTLTNTATVSGTLRDTDLTNNTSTVQTRVIGPDICPPYLVNPHQNAVIFTTQTPQNTSLIRVNVFGTKYFDVSKIDVNSVTFAGAKPVGDFMKKINADQIMDRTFIFAGNDPAFKTLPQGFTTVVLSGKTTTGQTFDPQAIVYNVNQLPYTSATLKSFMNMVAAAATQAHKVKVKVNWRR